MSEANWAVKLELTVKGPKEGAVKSVIEYEATSKEVAVGLQNALAQIAINANKQGKF